MTDTYKTTFTDRLRERTRTTLGGPCPTCGQPTGGATRESATTLGISHTTLWRFLRGGKPSALLVDRLVDWLDEHEEAEARARLVRAEHEATHGEAEMCGAECIALGLADFAEEPEQ